MRLFLLVALLSTATALHAGAPPAQASIDAAVAAYERGDLARARSAFSRLSRDGVPAADYNLAVMNLRGELPQASPREALRLMTRAAEAGFVTALFGLGHEVPEDEEVFAARAQKLELFVLTATNESKVVEQAHVVLAAAAHVEDEGSFMQGDGIIQRFRRAYPPRADSQPHWKWAVDLARQLGLELKATSSREVFKLLAPSVPELASFEWDKKAPMNQKRPGITPLAAAADGRPPGFREQGIPNLRGLTLPPGT